MVTESLEASRRKQLPYVLLFYAVFGVVCCMTMYNTNIRDLRSLQTSGVPGIGRVTGFVPQRGRNAPQYIYELNVGGEAFSGSSVYWDAVRKSATAPAKVGDPVTVYYLADRPSVNRPGNPHDQLGVWYLLFAFFVTSSLASAYGSFALFKRKKADTGTRSAGCHT